MVKDFKSRAAQFDWSGCLVMQRHQMTGVWYS